MGFAAWLAVLARLARKNLDRLAPPETDDEGEPKVVASFTVYSFLSGLDTVMPLLAAIAAAVGMLSVYVVWIVLYSFADVIIAVVEAHRRLKSYKP